MGSICPNTLSDAMAFNSGDMLGLGDRGAETIWCTKLHDVAVVVDERVLVRKWKSSSMDTKSLEDLAIFVEVLKSNIKL